MNGIIQESVVPVIPGGEILPAAIFGNAGDGVGAYLKRPDGVASVTYTTPLAINVAPGVLYLTPSAPGAAVVAGGTQTEYGPTPGATVDW